MRIAFSGVGNQKSYWSSLADNASIVMHDSPWRFEVKIEVVVTEVDVLVVVLEDVEELEDVVGTDVEVDEVVTMVLLVEVVVANEVEVVEDDVEEEELVLVEVVDEVVETALRHMPPWQNPSQHSADPLHGPPMPTLHVPVEHMPFASQKPTQHCAVSEHG